METIKQVIYRNEDQVLATVSNTEKVVTPFIPDLTTNQQLACNNLKALCESKIDTPLLYVVYTALTNTLSIQQTEGENPSLLVLEMTPEDKVIVDAVGTICTQLLNQ